MWVRSLVWEDPLEEHMATRSSMLAWKTPWREEPDGLQSESDMIEQLSMHIKQHHQKRRKNKLSYLTLYTLQEFRYFLNLKVLSVI